MTYGISFPFRDSLKGTYLRLTETISDEIRSDLLHLLLTRKGSRYYMPDFGTRLYEFIFEPFDNVTFSAIESDIRESVQKYLPNLLINNISIEPYNTVENVIETPFSVDENMESASNIYRVPGKGTTEYTAKVRIDYSVTSSVFNESDFIIINI